MVHVAWPPATPNAVAIGARRAPRRVLRILSAVSCPGGADHHQGDTEEEDVLVQTDQGPASVSKLAAARIGTSCSRLSTVSCAPAFSRSTVVAAPVATPIAGIPAALAASMSQVESPTYQMSAGLSASP